MKKNRHVFLSVFLCALLAFTAYVLLDTFVIVRRIETAAEPQAVSARVDSQTDTPAAAQLAAPAEENNAAVTVLTENSYSDGSMSIVITEERVGDTAVYVADVLLASADQLKTAFADNTYGRNVTDTTSGIAESVGAVLAINGDYYGAQQSGYVIRSGVLYRSTAKKGAEDLVIYADGSFGIIRETEITAQELLEQARRMYSASVRRWWKTARSPSRPTTRWGAQRPATRAPPSPSSTSCIICSSSRTDGHRTARD